MGRVAATLKKLVPVLGHLIAVIFLTEVVVNLVVKAGQSWGFGTWSDLAAQLLFNAALIFVAVIYIAKVFSVGPKWFRQNCSIEKLVLGTVVGFLLIVCVFGAGAVLRVYHFRRIALTGGVLLGQVGGMLLLVAISEELIFRGLLMLAARKRFGIKGCLAVTSILFSITHGLNPGFSAVAFLNITLVGILFGALYIKSSNLSLPVGLHFGWNLVEGVVFSFPVSGHQFTKGLVEVSTGKAWPLLSGGVFGPEGGLLTTVVLSVALLVVFRLSGYKDVL